MRLCIEMAPMIWSISLLIASMLGERLPPNGRRSSGNDGRLSAWGPRTRGAMGGMKDGGSGVVSGETSGDVELMDSDAMGSKVKGHGPTKQMHSVCTRGKTRYVTITWRCLNTFDSVF